MIISLNLYNKYFKSIILLLLLIPRIKRFELLMIDLKSIVLPLNYILYIETNRNRTYIGTLSKYYSNQLNYSFYNYIHIYIYIYGVNEN